MIEISEEDFSIEEMVEKAKRRDTGAVVSFLGTVRDNHKDGCLLGMEVEAYREAALEELERIRKEALERFDLKSVDVVHRVGSLSVGDNIVIIVCSAPHRTAAFLGCEYVLEELKRRVSIWKKEIGEEEDRWVESSPK
jgi:molybdopterin synthase catalytic subunit